MSRRRDEDDDDDYDTPKKNKRPASRRRDEDDDDDDYTPRRKKKGAAEGGNQKLILIGSIAGVLLIGVVIAAIAIFGSSSGKDKTAKKTDDPPAEVKPQQPDANPEQNPNANPGTKPEPRPKRPRPEPKLNPGTTEPKPPEPKQNPEPKPPEPKPPEPKPKEKQLEETELATSLPPPPKIKISGSAVPDSKPVVKPPAIPPLAPDEDPFVRAQNFQLEGLLPKLPDLPPHKDRPLLTLEAGGHTDLISKVFFTPKGDRIITIARDKAVRIWDPATNETIQTIRFPAGPGAEGSLQAAAISRNGQRLAVAGQPVGTLAPGKGAPIYIVSPDTGAQTKRLDVGRGTIECLHFSNDGRWLAVGCDNGAIQVVDVNTGASEYRQPGTASVLEVKFNPNQKVKMLASLGADRYVQIWNFANASQHKDFPIRGVVPSTLAWSNDGRTLAIGTTTGDIMLGTAEGALIKVLRGLTHRGKPVQINQIQFLPGDKEIAACGVGANAAGWAGIVNADTGKTRTAFTQHSNVVFALDVSADGKQIVTSGGSNHETYVWSAEDGKILQRFVGTGNGVWSIAWSKDGKSLAWGTSNVRDEYGHGKLENSFRLDEFGVGDAPDGSKYTQRVTSDEHAKIVSIPGGFGVQTTGRQPTLIPAPPGEKIYSSTVLPKGNAVIVAASASLRMLNPATLRETRAFVGHTGNVLCVTPSPDGRLFATGSTDQTIRIWQRDKEDPLLSIFVSGRDWIAWTPQGYYACSGQGERLIAWQLAALAGKVPQVHPAERFRASMYQPALLKYLIPAGDMPRALAMAQKYDKALVQTINVADVIPPEVTLEGFGETEVKVEKETITVKASAKSAKHPITALRLLVNGRPYQGTAGVKRFDNSQLAVDASWDVKLPPGTHTFAVIADSPVSKGMSKVGIAVRSGEIPKPNLYMLAIGVSDYPGKSKLNFCASDAELLAKAFKEKSTGAFKAIGVKVLTDKQATKKGILEGLDWLKSKMTAQDVGIVSFSGHGLRDPFGQFYLVPIDFNPADIDCTTALSGKLFKEKLDNMPGRLVAILDACHSGTVAEKERAPVQADSLVRDLTAEDSGVIVMCASAGREFAIETKLTKAGFYTFGLVEGLSGLGDVDGDGVIYIHELDMYASARVKQLSKGFQNPTLGRPSTVRPFPIAKVEKSPEP